MYLEKISKCFVWYILKLYASLDEFFVVNNYNSWMFLNLVSYVHNITRKAIANGY